MQSDADAVEPILEDLKDRDALPEEMLADASYGSDSNVQLAKKEGVSLIAPVPSGKKYDGEEVGYDQFQLNEAKEVIACPAGHTPKSTKYNAKTNQVWAQMDAEVCRACPLMAQCRVQKDKAKKANGRVQFRLDAQRAAERRRQEQTEEFRSLYRWRAGIEATNSSLKRQMNLKRLRVRGFKAVKMAILLKLTGWNLLRAVALRAERSRTPEVALT